MRNSSRICEKNDQFWKKEVHQFGRTIPELEFKINSSILKKKFTNLKIVKLFIKLMNFVSKSMNFFKFDERFLNC